MKFKVLVANDKSDHWWEEYDKPCSDADAMARDIIQYFNDTLRPHESPRRIVEVVVLDPRENTDAHVWKKARAMTQMAGGSVFDVYKCEYCGIIGRRHGLNPEVVRDRKFSAKLYASCQKARAHLESKRAAERK